MNSLNNINSSMGRLKLGLGIALLAVVTGCVGYVGGGGAVYVPGPPDVVFFGGGFEHEHVHEYSHRGFESRHWDHHR